MMEQKKIFDTGGMPKWEVRPFRFCMREVACVYVKDLTPLCVQYDVHVFCVFHFMFGLFVALIFFVVFRIIFQSNSLSFFESFFNRFFQKCLNRLFLFPRRFGFIAFFPIFSFVSSFFLSCAVQTKQHFRDYMEDYNTNTLPHEKYIDLEKWEMAEFHREYRPLFCFLDSLGIDRSTVITQAF